MTYKQVINYLFSRLPIYQRDGLKSYKPDLDNILKACKILKNPQHKFKSIHIAGTNGKGSVSHMLSSILQQSKYKVGLYTSPHLKDFRERIKINGRMISKSDVIKFVTSNKKSFEKIDLSFFEFTVSLAFHYFAFKKVDIAIIETGLGGRLDSTNVISPILSIITNISMDHSNLLGNKIHKIAAEKGGIIKKNTPVIIGRKQKDIQTIFEKIAFKNNTKIQYADSYKFNSELCGFYQKENINTAVSAVMEIKRNGWNITNKNIKLGLLNIKRNTGFLGRWQKLDENPLIICDTGHNVDAIKNIIYQISKISYECLHIVLGLSEEKDIQKILKLLPTHATYYFCKANISKGLDEYKLQKIASKLKLLGNCYDSVNKAFDDAKQKSSEKDLIFIGGSTFIVSEIL